MMSLAIRFLLCFILVATIVSADNKYFHEPGEDELHRHYDTRFFQGIVSDEERQITLTALIRAYLLLFDKFNLETWIGKYIVARRRSQVLITSAHGTLLGWFWNGKILPWVCGPYPMSISATQ